MLTSNSSHDHRKNLLVARKGTNGEMMILKILRKGYFHSKGNCLTLETEILKNPPAF